MNSSVHSRLLKTHAFTLVELLVVIAILAILASLVFPSLQQSIAQGRFAKCTANLRGLGTGCLAFAADNNGGLPHADQGPAGTKLSWVDVAVNGDSGKNISQEQARNLGCPCTPFLAQSPWKLYGTSLGYGYNPNLGTSAYYFTQQISDGNSYPNVRLAAVARPSQVILAADTGQNASYASQEVVSMWSSYGCMRVQGGVWQLASGRANPSRAEQVLDPKALQEDVGGVEYRVPAWPLEKGKTYAARHNGKINCLFVDGHVEALRPEQIKEKNIFWSY
jgi:prepilin-type processing-associated H-X9-DG protein/prepilin-type N-terminal cleavage/methylation domain-containing protein